MLLRGRRPSPARIPALADAAARERTPPAHRAACTPPPCGLTWPSGFAGGLPDGSWRRALPRSATPASMAPPHQPLPHGWEDHRQCNLRHDGRAVLLGLVGCRLLSFVSSGVLAATRRGRWSRVWGASFAGTSGALHETRCDLAVACVTLLFGVREHSTGRANSYLQNMGAHERFVVGLVNISYQYHYEEKECFPLSQYMTI